MTPKRPDSTEIRALLRRGDPAQGESLGPEDVSRLRRRLAEEAARPEAFLLGPRRLVWAALAAVLLALVVLELRTTSPPPPAVPGSMVQAVQGRDAIDRQVHFETAGGTRIVWVLSTNLDL